MKPRRRLVGEDTSGTGSGIGDGATSGDGDVAGTDVVCTEVGGQAAARVLRYRMALLSI